MGTEDKKDVIKKIFVIIFFVVAIIAIIVLLLPSKEQNKETVISNQTTGEKLKVVGDNPYYLMKGTTFEDPGYKAYDATGTDISYKIVKSGAVNEKEPGEYLLIYRLGDIEIKRTVIVYNFEAILVEDSEEYTNEPYNLMVLIKGNNYDKTLLPNGKTTKDRAIEYEIDKNGTYKFIAYDTHKNQITIEKTVTNFDKEGPTGTCENKLDVGKTYVTVNATDNHSGVVNYVYSNGKDYSRTNEPKHTFNGLYKDVTVTLIDGLGNTNKITCKSSGEGTNPQIKPPVGAKIVESSDSDTLKISIEQVNNYYIARVWVLDPYTQIRKATSEWGVRREHPITIFKKEVEKQKLSNKIFIGINASGFYENGSWTPSVSSEYYNKYNRTTEGGLVITNGQTIRNWYQDGAVDKACFGTNELCRTDDTIYVVSKEGYLDTYQKFGRLSEGERETLFNQIINKGYLNTWVFRPVLILNGKETVDSSSLTGNANTSQRTLVCQINRNNWVLLVGNITNKEVLPKLKSLGCQTAISMDGGGSYAMMYKDQTNGLKTIVGGNREIVDTLYITEK